MMIMICVRLAGFDLSAMKPTQFEDGIVEIVDAKEVMTTECALKVGRVNEGGTSESQAKPSPAEPKREQKRERQADLAFSSFFFSCGDIELDTDQDIDTNRVTVPELDFKSPFVLEPVSTSSDSSSTGAPMKTKMRAFLTWFDTFFSPDASHEGQAPLGRDTQYVKYEEDAYRRDVPVVSAKKTGDEGEGQKKGKEVSFTTGPRGKATHWKQVAFMLKEPVEVPVGEYCTRVCVSDAIGLAQVGSIVGSRHWVASFGLFLRST